MMLHPEKAAAQIITDSAEPAGAASPIGNRDDIKYFDARYANGIRAKIIDAILWAKEMPDSPYAQK